MRAWPPAISYLDRGFSCRPLFTVLAAALNQGDAASFCSRTPADFPGLRAGKDPIDVWGTNQKTTKHFRCPEDPSQTWYRHFASRQAFLISAFRCSR